MYCKGGGQTSPWEAVSGGQGSRRHRAEVVQRSRNFALASKVGAMSPCGPAVAMRLRAVAMLLLAKCTSAFTIVRWTQGVGGGTEWLPRHGHAAGCFEGPGPPLDLAAASSALVACSAASAWTGSTGGTGRVTAAAAGLGCADARAAVRRGKPGAGPHRRGH